MKRVDLHVHTRASDGELSPAEMVHAAAAGGLDVVAVTDHDTLGGVREALEAARALPLHVVTGIELSSRYGDDEIHVLGYFVDPAAPALVAHQESAVGRRMERMRQMVRRLQDLGLHVEYEDVLEAAGPEARVIGRPHVARALVARGQVRSMGEAFDRYLGDAGVAFVRTDLPPVRTAIDMILEAGGIAVWAHPDARQYDEALPVFAGWGLGGVECYRPHTPPDLGRRYRRAAEALGLHPTGGSDWHGPHRSRLGDYFVPGSDVAPFLDAGFPGWSEPPVGPVAGD
jgi:3',5'-nucleoside bisphosphate phosphatase